MTSAADDDTPGTLRWAVTQANVTHGEDAIAFDPAVFDKPTTITLTRGPLEFLDPARTTVTGPPAGVTVRGAGASRVAQVGDEKVPAAARLVDLTIADGQPDPAVLEYRGGGVSVSRGSALELVGCTVRDCSAEDGGGVYSDHGTVTLVNCTFARNRAKSEGGAIKSYGYGGAARLTAVNCTFVGNEGALPRGGGGVYNHTGRAELFNCLFAAHPTGAITHVGDGAVTVGAGNLTDDESSADYATYRADLRVGPLGRHGGPTETVPLLPGSPAINAGANDRVPKDLTTDQRGRPRIAGGRVDVGAVEAK